MAKSILSCNCLYSFIMVSFSSYDSTLFKIFNFDLDKVDDKSLKSSVTPNFDSSEPFFLEISSNCLVLVSSSLA